jgi:hypothetical protein
VAQGLGLEFKQPMTNTPIFPGFSFLVCKVMTLNSVT